MSVDLLIAIRPDTILVPKIKPRNSGLDFLISGRVPDRAQEARWVIAKRHDSGESKERVSKLAATSKAIAGQFTAV